MKSQRLLSRIILGLMFICIFIPPGSCLELGVNVLSENITILSADPSGNFSLDVDEAQMLSATLDRNATSVWYVDEIEIQTDHNTTTPDYYFTSSTSGVFNVTVICRDSLTNTSQVNFTWFITVSDVEPYPTTPRAVQPSGAGQYIPPELTTEDVDIEPPTIWDDTEKIDKKDIVDNTILSLGMLFSLLFLYTLKKGGGDDNNPGRKEPIKL